ncbi:MAG: M28 family peptidase [Balneolaceae bacterium]|nr:MAG: M28 family peptidase [Balneolaceae bacterium]
MAVKHRFFSLLILILILAGCNQNRAQDTSFETVDSARLLADIEFLASDELEGRFPGTEGNRIAREFIAERFHTLGLSMFGDTFEQPFSFTNRRTGVEFEDAINLIGYIEGSMHPERFIVVTAHYDHLGIQDGEIFNGADDNASGTGGLMAAARYFSHNQPQSSILFVAFDAEEQGLQGAHYFVENPPVDLDSIVLNVNMDMISTNFDDELYAVGTYHYPFLKPLVEEATSEASIDVLFGYDNADAPQDWTMSSDHGPFHLKGIPFIYFGVEDHPHYHQPSDTFENINPDFYVAAVETIIGVIRHFDQNIEHIIELSER